MIRVLHFLQTLNAAGAETVIVNYFNHMDKTRVMFDFCIKSSSEKGYYEDFLSAEGSRIFKVKYRLRQYGKYVKELKSIFEKNRYDIVHINTGSALWYVIAEVAKKSGVKNVIYHSHSSNAPFVSKCIQRIIKPRVDKWSDHKLACSDAAGKYTFCGDYKLVKNAIEIKKFEYSEQCRNEIRDKYRLGDKIVIGHVGRLEYPKNQKFLLDIIPFLRNKLDDFVFMFIGDGADKDALIKYAVDKGVADKAIFIGNVGSDIYRYYSAFDIFAFPSFNEGLSVVTVEAQANGLPVLASETISTEHKLSDNFTFLPIDNKSVEIWADKIIKSIGNRKDNTQSLISSGYDIETEAKKLQDYYLELG